MNYPSLILMRAKALFREAGSVIILVMMLVVSLVIVINERDAEKSYFRLAVVNMDSGELGKKLIDEVRREAGLDVVLTDEETADRWLSTGRVKCKFYIKENFSETLQNSRFENIVELTVVPDNPYTANISEPVINGVLKLWMEEKTIDDVCSLVGMTEETEEEFRTKIAELWINGSSIVVRDHIQTKAEETEESTAAPSGRGAKLFAALTLFYYVIGGMWMVSYGRNHLAERILQKGGKLYAVYLCQAIPSLVVTLIGFTVVSAVETGGLLAVPAYFIYSIGCMGMALIICSFSGGMISLIYLAPVTSLIAALFSGLITELPAWAAHLENVMRILPGRWLVLSFNGEGSPALACLVSLLWVVCGIGVSYIRIALKKKKTMDEN